MATVTGLRCRACDSLAPVDAGQACPRCWGPLAPDYDWAGVAVSVSRAAIEAGPPSIWRYGRLLPVEDGPHAGWTPLVRARALGDALGLDELWLKDETANPTGSFKDRVVATALARARELGCTVAASASTGNLARAVAAGAAACGMRAVLLVPSSAAAGVAAVSPDALVVAVYGPYDAANRLSVELSSELPEWAWVNVTLRAWYVEGSKSVAFETAEQLGWRSPAHVMAPIASGALALQLHEGFAALRRTGLLDVDATPPRLSAAQPGGCAPVAAAFAAGHDDVTPVRPQTSVASLAMGDPPDGREVLAAARRTGGAVVAVPEDDVDPAVELLSRMEGIAVEPAGGVAVAALAELARAGVIAPDESVVAYLTGGPVPPSDGGEPAVTIEPTVEAFSSVAARLLGS